jgi:hypothetical protein
MGRQTSLLAAALLLTAIVVAGCAAESSPDAAGPIEVTDAGHGFELTLSVPASRFAANEPIGVRATLTWTGTEPSTELWAAMQGPILFWVLRVDDQWQLGPASDGACATYTLERGVPEARSFEKSLGWSADDPQATFYEGYAQDPLLRLPAGRWRVFAAVDGLLAPCAGDAPRLELTTSADILVE